jgi:hypothetical protein
VALSPQAKYTDWDTGIVIALNRQFCTAQLVALLDDMIMELLIYILFLRYVKVNR